MPLAALLTCLRHVCVVSERSAVRADRHETLAAFSPHERTESGICRFRCATCGSRISRRRPKGAGAHPRYADHRVTLTWSMTRLMLADVSNSYLDCSSCNSGSRNYSQSHSTQCSSQANSHIRGRNDGRDQNARRDRSGCASRQNSNRRRPARLDGDRQSDPALVINPPMAWRQRHGRPSLHRFGRRLMNHTVHLIRWLRKSC